MLIYNTDYLVAAMVFLLIVLYHFVKNRALDLEDNRLFFHLVMLGISNIVFDGICAVLISFPSPDIFRLSWFCLTILITLRILVPHTLLYYVRSYLPPSARHKKVKSGMNILLSVLILMIFWNRWCGIFFMVDDDGTFYQGPLHLFVHVVSAGYMTAVAGYSIRYRKHLKKFRVLAIWEVLAVSAVMAVLQLIYPHVLLRGFGIALSVTILFFTVNNPYYYTDSLTGAFDIRYFRERCRSFIEHHKNFHLISVDISQIRRINLVLGSEFGSNLLIAISGMLRSTHKQNMVFRISGKRFLVMAPTLGHYELVRYQVEHFFKNPISVKGEQVQVPVKICGIRNAQQLGNSNTILSYFEYLMTHSAVAGDMTVVEGTDETLKGFHYMQEVERYLDVALQHDLFEVVFQPVYSLQDSKFVSVEVLSRLHHPGLGMIPPDIFIGVAEKNDQIAQIGLMQMERVCRFIQEHPQILHLIHNMKFNLSPAELMKPGHGEALVDIIHRYEIPTSFFQFEITETVATEYNEAMGKVTSRFTDAGIGLCMDDFGSGFANLNSVLKLPFRVIKLDRSLLFGICQDARTASLYESIVYSLHNMGFYILSEGIETKEELDLVAGWGVDMIQGYYFSRPLPGTDMLKKVSEAPAQKLEVVRKRLQA